MRRFRGKGGKFLTLAERAELEEGIDIEGVEGWTNAQGETTQAIRNRKALEAGFGGVAGLQQH